MIEVRISELPLAGPITGSELVEIVQGGKNKRARASAISSATFQRQAGATISALTVVWEDSLGIVRPVSNTDAAYIDLIAGITVTSASTGGTVTVQRSGALDLTGLGLGTGRAWLGANGRLTQVPPTSGYDVLAGYVTSDQRIYIDFSEAIYL